jgi:hypothetical protein
MHLAVLDPDPYWYLECASGFRSMEIDKNLQVNLVSCLSFERLLYLCMYVSRRIRIRLDPNWFGFLDPDPDPH